ncbi:hypothetical protein P40081_15265 [Paenibacillus sp. FSL P4-0081]|nr:hypothetical protein P40081_15265 [Paenibacillus sp. FSL P4-0081]
MCPRNECRQAFIGVYKKILVKDPIKPVDYVLVRTEPQIKYIKKDIDTRIMSISPVFATIFSEAGEAEALNLENIAGMGYRKSLEFLIKDYLISKNIEDRENIERKSLGQCINQDIDNPNIKSMAARAAWLGNDETHYSRKHASMSIIDLKLLIEATQYWILMELIKDEYQSKLPNAR